jgi:hypothetical protein
MSAMSRASPRVMRSASVRSVSSIALGLLARDAADLLDGADERAVVHVQLQIGSRAPRTT